MRKLAFSSLYLIMLIILKYCKSDCDHRKIIENLGNICKVYGQPSTFKREIKGTNDRIRPIIQDIETGETKTEYQYSANTDGSPIVPVEGNPFLQWVSKNNPQITPPPEFSDLSEHHYQRERDLETNGLSNEPEDFASLNTWYLNPVYAEAEIEELSPMERLRNIRQNRLVDSLIHICCNTTTGCPYPEGYLKFADEHKICF